MRVLVIEDEPKVASFIQTGLADDALDVDLAADGCSAAQLMQSSRFDLIILDIVLPDVDGFTVCRRVREHDSVIPILMLSARGMVADRVRGLDAGADDYLTKPFAFDELSARVRALLRRPRSNALHVLQVGTLALDPVTRIVSSGYPAHRAYVEGVRRTGAADAIRRSGANACNDRRARLELSVDRSDQRRRCVRESPA